MLKIWYTNSCDGERRHTHAREGPGHIADQINRFGADNVLTHLLCKSRFELTEGADSVENSPIFDLK